jgi:formamidopyrimidine-DNA glycosylase
MPELPEVEVIRRGLASQIVGRRVLGITRGEKSLRRQSPAAELRRWVSGRRILDLSRRGKYLIFVLEDGVRLLVHLGMTGRLLLGPALPGPASCPSGPAPGGRLELGSRTCVASARRWSFLPGRP